MPTVKLVELRRVSTAAQAADDKDGLPRQQRSNAATAARLRAEIIHTVEIENVSRSNFRDTPEWRSVEALITAPDVHIVVDRMDRFSGGFEGMTLLLACQVTNTVIYTASGDFDLSTQAGAMGAGFLTMQAGDERKSILYRTMSGKEKKRTEGHWVAPLRNLPTGIGYIRATATSSHRWTFTADIAKIQTLFRLVAHGRTNWRQISKEVDIIPKTLANALANPIYIGTLVYDERRDMSGPAPIDSRGRKIGRKKTVRVSDVIKRQVYRPRGVPAEPGDTREEAAIDLATWEAVQTILARKKEGYFAEREADSRYALSSLLACHYCGKPLTSKGMHSPNGLRRYYYVCPSTQVSGPKCPTRYLRIETVHSTVDSLVTLRLSRPDFLRPLIEATDERSDDDLIAQIETAKKATAKLEAKRSKLLDLYLDADGVSKDVYEAKRITLDTQIVISRREVAALEAKLDRAAGTAAIDALSAKLSTLTEFEFCTAAEKRELLRVTYPRLYLSEQGVTGALVRMPLLTYIGGREVPVGGDEMRLKVNFPWTLLPVSRRHRAGNLSPLPRGRNLE